MWIYQFLGVDLSFTDFYFCDCHQHMTGLGAPHLIHKPCSSSKYKALKSVNSCFSYIGIVGSDSNSAIAKASDSNLRGNSGGKRQCSEGDSRRRSERNSEEGKRQ